jgi:predicted metal-dependent hydrolase
MEYPERDELNAVIEHSIVLFEKGQYYECHEGLEKLWLRLKGLEKHFLAGLILLAAAMHKSHVQRNLRAARLLYSRAVHHLAWISDTFHGIDVRGFEHTVFKALPHHRVRPTVPRDRD